MTEDELSSIAWRDFLLFAIGYPDLRKAYEADTGNRFTQMTDRSHIEMMIDEATGYFSEGVMAFAIWATRTQWGWDEAPASFREAADGWQASHPSYGPLGRDAVGEGVDV